MLNKFVLWRFQWTTLAEQFGRDIKTSSHKVHVCGKTSDSGRYVGDDDCANGYLVG